ncbi:MAG: DUF4834 family protein [Rikenellaceae bacterium]
MFNWIKDNPLLFLLIFLAVAAPSLFVGAMRVIFYIIFGIIILLLILGIIFRAKIRKLQKQAEQQMGSGAGGFYSSYSSRSRQSAPKQEEGDVNIFSQGAGGEKKISNDVGDYVDFEEVKEKK